MIPDHITQRIAQYQRPALPLVDIPGVSVGDLRNARPAGGGPSRLVLVVALTDSGSAQITLVHPYVDLATGSDLVVPKGSSDLAYDLVVETDLAGVVWLTALGKRVGSVPAAVVDACLTGTLPAGMPEVYFGHSLAGSLDVRWAFKDREGDEIEALAADCTDSLLDGKTLWRPDVSEVLRKFFEHAPNFERAMAALVDEWLRSGDDMVLEAADWDVIIEQGLSERDSWASQLGEEIGGLFWDAVLQSWYFRSIQSNRRAPAEGAKVEVRGFEYLASAAR